PAVVVLAGGGGGRVGDHLDERLVIVAVGGEAVGVERGVAVAAGAVAGLEVEGAAVGLEGEPAAALPDAALGAVGGDVQDAGEFPAAAGEVGDVPGDDPAVVRPLVAVGGPLDVDGAADEVEGAAFVFAQGVELVHRLAGAVVRVGDRAGAVAVGVDRGVVGVVVGGVADQERGDAVGDGGEVNRVQPRVEGGGAADRWPCCVR